jgi:hypothetical protein
MIPLLFAALAVAQAVPSDRELIQAILETTEPLAEPRGERLPLLIWPAHDLGTDNETELEALLRELDRRGMVPIARWRPDDPEALERALRLGRLSKRLGMPVVVSATASTYSFFDGDPRTAHIDPEGRPFFDESFAADRPMGCPFAIDFRIPEMRRRIASAVRAYETAGIPIDIIYADWEIDGPLEWNGAWESSKKCTRCRRAIPDIDDFASFPAALRRKRSELERVMLAEPVLETFPGALVGNYGVYPHDGYRYWFDYFEKMVDGAPHRTEGGARYRKWYPEFPETGFTFAMPVVYPWYDTFFWYDFESTDYRWFYNMLLAGTNAARATPENIPIITFVHWHTTEPPPTPDLDPAVRQLSREAYEELLWHLLLRGHDTFFLWSPRDEALEETQILFEVYRESNRYRDFLLEGTPVLFDVPSRPGAVVSALRKGRQLLVRRTDFDDRTGDVTVEVDGRTIVLPRDGPPLRLLQLER